MPQPANGTFPIKFTLAQRQVIAETVPDLADRLKLNEPNQRVIVLTLDELRTIHECAGPAVFQVDSGMKRASLRCVLDITARAIKQVPGQGFTPNWERLYQFKITLIGAKPAIWRRMQTKDCSLDRLHEHIQTAMGWTNSHLNHFKIDNQLYGDPLLMEETFEELGYKDSTKTRLTQILPQDGKRFRFKYEYDFGDSWEHEVLFEGVLRAEDGRHYPICLEGERACPPEDVGGVGGYFDFLEIIRNPKHEVHEQMLEWVGGKFDPEEFDPVVATKAMLKGLPDWRRGRRSSAY